VFGKLVFSVWYLVFSIDCLAVQQGDIISSTLY
jgi:hypothetical protein